ncbi:MAG TPA: sulfotransferase domain-containing protein [Ktedonobacteraceae bacterium]|nr:sulfotransferase domain-containing protein [Ktedonobacteraceae bacterium]
MIKPVRDVAQSSISFYRTMTSSIRLLPDFIIIGAQRGGTTSLYAYLSQHPQIAPAVMKEVHFFDNNFQKGVSWYRAQFPSIVEKYLATNVGKQDFITGEASPYYLFHPHVPQRVAKLVPYVRLIVLLRNPVDRAYSHYYHEVELGRETLSFEEALAQEEARTHEESARIAAEKHYRSYNHQNYTYLARGIYANQLERWLSLFPREQLLVIKSEDFYADPDSIFQQTQAFLNVRPMEHKPPQWYKQYNNSTYKQAKMEPHLRKRLVAYFEPHNDRLYKLLKRDFGWDR